MLQQNVSLMSRNTGDADSDGNQNPDTIDFERFFGVLRRQWKLVALAALVGALCGIGYMATATPYYRATAEILLDQNNGQIATQVTGAAEPSRTEEAILSQLELLGSRGIAEAAVDKLKLGDNPEFLESGRTGNNSIVSFVRSLLAIPSVNRPAASPESRRNAAIGLVTANTSVARIGRTYFLSVSYSAANRQLAADVANALAEAYLTDQLTSKYDATRLATVWMGEQIDKLRQESLVADRKVQDYKRTNNLIEVSGQLVSDQQLGQINTALSAASTKTSEAKSKLDVIRTALASDNPNAIVADALDSSSIKQLQQSYLEYTARYADVVQRVGENHDQAINLKKQIDQVQAQMRGELGRIAESYQTSYEVAVLNEQNLQASLATATNTSADANSTKTELRELELSAQSVSQQYQTLLRSFQESSQTVSFPVGQARIVTAASTPGRPSSPVAPVSIGLAVLLGGTIGLGVAGLREFRDRFVRTGDHLRSSIGIEYLGMVPEMQHKSRPIRNAVPTHAPNVIAGLDGTVYYDTVENPMSQFAETLRGAKVAADLAMSGQAAKVIGMVSVLPEEGKSTLSSNFASLLALNGNRTILIDGDIRHPLLSRVMAPQAALGLVEILVKATNIEQIIHIDPRTGLHMIPVGTRESVPNSADLLSSAAFENLLTLLRKHYDYIIVDLPPIGAVVDARAVSKLIDAYVFVVQWGRLPRQFLRNILRTEERIADKTLGAILNKVDLNKLKLYRSADSSEYYLSSYNNYFTS